jgi:hypothetical protein
MPQLPNINEFLKGDNRDIDNLKMPNDTARRIQNMRVLDVDGKGLVLTNVGGTEAKFRLSPGFIPLGKCEYNGVGYIASVNPETGQGELGCYPAPLALVNKDCNQTGWGTDKQYAPLFNFTGVNPPRDENVLSEEFRTDLFNFNCEHQIDMFAREDYDGSVGLYVAQLENPIRVFNTGFDQDGSCISIGRRYWNNSFPNAVNLLHEAECHIDVEFLGLGPAGSIRGGNWIYFVRYSTENFDKTSFFTETNAIQITNGTYAADGIHHHGVIAGQETDKSVNLRFSDIDPTYSYLEIGYIYNFDEQQEFGIIDKLYPIDPNQSVIDIEITGFEGFFEVGAEVILDFKPNYDGATTHTQLENRYFAGNLFDTTKFGTEAVEELLEFSRKITCQYDDSKQIAHLDGSGYRGIYNNEMNVYNFTGHFRGEGYPYGLVFVLTNGRETQAFPITGSDDFNGAGGVPNDQGIYRFPNPDISPTISGNFVNVMGIKFDISTAFAALPQFVQDSVSGFYFVRGERNETLLYQGVTIPCYNAEEGLDPRIIPIFAFSDYPKVLKRNENIVPMFEVENDSEGAVFPFILRFDLDDLNNNEFTFTAQFKKLTERIDGNWGFYSPDHFFNRSLGVKKAFIFPFATIDFNGFTEDDPSKDDYYYGDISYAFAQTGARSLQDVFNIAEWEQSNNSGFTSYFNEGAKSDFNSMFYLYEKNLTGTKYLEIRNMPMAWNTYIGIKSTFDMRYKLSNIYKGSTNPEGFDIKDFYDVKATKYYKISKFYKISDIQANNSIINDEVYYKGDCFLQRTWHKQLFNPKYGTGVKDDGGGSITSIILNWLDFDQNERLFTFGVVYSLITENKINTEMRRGDFTKKFYPGTYDTVYDFAVKDIEKESELLNKGYNQVLSQKFYTGIDEDIPFFPEDKPVGIMYSNKHNPGSLLDGYRQIDLSALREYDYRMGEITSLQVLNNLLVSIQKEGVNRHFVNEKAVLNQGESAGELLLGTGDILDPKHLNITDFLGSQHQWSIIATEKAVYGVDENKRKIWRLMGNLQMEVISDMKGYKTTLHELCETSSNESDIVEQLPDNPVCNAGIVAHYDRKHNDIYFTWIYGNPEVLDDCSLKDVGATIVFNEWLDSFHGERTSDTAMRMNINEDFFSFDSDIFPSMNPNPSGSGQARLHDIFEIGGSDNATTFFNNPDPDICFVEFIVNNPADIAKVFDNMQISSSPDDLYRVTYETQHQESIHFPWRVGDEVNYWRDPAYTENLWKLPIIRTQEIQEPTNNIYGVDSRFRGRWIKIRLEWKTKSRIFIKSVITHVRESHN